MTFWKTVGAVLLSHLIVSFIWVIVYASVFFTLLPKK